MRERRGFSLIELLITLSVIGILASIVMPMFRSVKERSYKTQAISDLTSLRTAEETFFADSNRYGSLSELGATYSRTPGIVITTLTDTPLSWTATLVHTQLPGVTCAIAVSTPNPVSSLAGEGEPVCK